MLSFKQFTQLSEHKQKTTTKLGEGEGDGISFNSDEVDFYTLRKSDLIGFLKSVKDSDTISLVTSGTWFCFQFLINEEK